MWVVSFYTQLSLQHDGLVQHPYHFSCSTNPSLNILLPSPVTCEQHLKIPKILHLGQDLIHDPEWALQTFPTEEHGGNLEMLILIPTAHTRPRPVTGKLEAISHQESDLLPQRSTCHSCELKISWTGASAWHSQRTFTVLLGVLGLSV